MTATTVQLDNLQAGDDIAIDDIAGRGHQQVKLVGGAIDDTTEIQAGSGLKATALRVTVATDRVSDSGTLAFSQNLTVRRLKF